MKWLYANLNVKFQNNWNVDSVDVLQDLNSIICIFFLTQN